MPLEPLLKLSPDLRISPFVALCPCLLNCMFPINQNPYGFLVCENK